MESKKDEGRVNHLCTDPFCMKDEGGSQGRMKVESTNLCIDSYCKQVRMKVESTTFLTDPCNIKDDGGVSQLL